MKAWREASSVIVLARNGGKPDTNKLNYNILFQKRSSKAKAFPNTIVFPGGVTEESDFSKQWIDYFKFTGISRDKFELLSNKNNTNTPIFQNNSLERHIGLRIAAIRETFEEVGVLICNKNKSNISNWASEYKDFDVKTWQKKVHNNSSEFFNLCETLECYPNLWALKYWSNWLTPPGFKSRFDTSFFVTAFNQTPNVTHDETEVASYKWETLDVIIDKGNMGEIMLLFPQKYELLRISKHKDLSQLMDYVENNSVNNPLYFPVQLEVEDGTVGILPGDDLYPNGIDYTKDYRRKVEGKTMEQLREGCKVLHRMEQKKTGTIENWQLLTNLQI